MAYLVVIRYEDDEKKDAQHLADTYEEREMLVGAFHVPDEYTDYCMCDEHDKRKFFGNVFNPRVSKDKAGTFRCKICKKPSSLTNTMPTNLRPKSDPDRRLTIRYWNRPWIGQTNYKNFNDRVKLKE